MRPQKSSHAGGRVWRPHCAGPGDGENTENRWTSNASQIDARTKLACDAAKAKNIKVYTVRVIEGNADLLRSCATTASMFYDVGKASDLEPIFKEIANSIRALRLTK